MANSKITDLPEISSVESTDVLVIVDVSVDETKKIKVSELKSSLDLTKIDVGLSNVDNTSDADKPISNSTQAALGLKANEADLQSHVNDLANPHQVTKAQIGLDQVDNTSDADKPVSIAAQAALDLKANSTALQNHIGDLTNPHQVTKSQIGLDQVDNTSDADKPISTATQSALNLKEDLSNKGAANGYTPLVDGLVPAMYLPGYVDDVIEVANYAALPILGEVSKLYITLDTHKTYRWSGATYIEVSPSDVNSVNGHTGIVVLTKSDIGLSEVDNTSDADKPVSTATQSALDLKANATLDNLQVSPVLINIESETTVKLKTANSAGASMTGSIFVDTGNTTGSKSGDFIIETGSGADTTGRVEIRPGEPKVGGTKGLLEVYTDIYLDDLYRVTNMVDPINDQDAATKKYADDGLSTKYDSSNPAGYITLAEIPAAPVTSVNTQTGDVVLDKSSVGLSEVNNTSDADKPVSTATQTALNNIINEYYIPKQVVNPSRCVSGAFPKLSNGQTSGASGNLIAQQVILVPFFINSTVTINSWTVRAGSGGIATASPVEVGFYSHQDGLPTNLIHSASITIPVLAGSTTSEQPITPVTLDRGVYWAAILNTSGATISLTDSNYASGSSFDLLFGQLMGTSTNITSSVPRGFHTSVAAGVSQLPASLVSRLVDFQFALANQSNLRIRTAVPIFYWGYTI